MSGLCMIVMIIAKIKMLNLEELIRQCMRFAQFWNVHNN